MSDIVVLGAGLNGLATAMLLAREGHAVTVLERDTAEPEGGNEELWTAWERRGVNQFNQLHFMLARWTQTMTAELPEVIEELEARGAARLNLVHVLPAAVTGGVRPGDARYETVTARRPVLEAALSTVAARTPGITVRRGVQVSGLSVVGRSAGEPQVNGVITRDGATVRADLVVDAGGRRSTVPLMLEAIGARRPLEEREPAGFVYYARHFRAVDGVRPSARALLLQHFHGYSVLTLPCDLDTWGVGFVTSSRDQSLKGLRDVEAWSRAMALVPTAREWIDAEPITDIQVIAGIEDRYRRFVVDDRPVCTGLVAVGDAWACTNPSIGRGASIGLLHAVALRDVVRMVGVADPELLVRSFDDATEAAVTPWYRATRAFDRHRLAEIDADLAGTTYRTPDPAWSMTTALYAAALHDPDALRAQISIAGMLATPTEALAAPRVLERVIAGGANRPRYPVNSPRHDELVAAVEDRPAPPKRRVQAAPVRLFVQDEGSGDPVLLLHGWPDTHALWHRQVAALTTAGYRIIAPDLRGFGDSDKPADVSAYGMLHVLADLLGVLNERELPRVHVVGHDWGAAIGCTLAAFAPDRVASLSCLSVGHPAAFAQAGWSQREKSWYMLLFQFAGIAEQWLADNDFANLRSWARHPQIEEVMERLRAPEALTASLGLYRAILAPESLVTQPAAMPPIKAPTMGIWSSGDLAVTEQAMTGTKRFVAGDWRYERIEGIGHWLPLDAAEHVNRLLLDFLSDCAQVTRAPAA
jgi:pimeloyl-ACP methyl ester carboxylesterase/2-polyprenyl-6-methoxyphenol hydroxylase-like FAD-dependent oxidoreductase